MSEEFQYLWKLTIKELESLRAEFLNDCERAVTQVAMVENELFKRGCDQYSGFDSVPGYARQIVIRKNHDDQKT